MALPRGHQSAGQTNRDLDLKLSHDLVGRQHMPWHSERVVGVQWGEPINGHFRSRTMRRCVTHERHADFYASLRYRPLQCRYCFRPARFWLN